MLSLRAGRLGVVGGGGYVAADTGPVGVHKDTGVVQSLVGVRTKVVPLCLDQVGGDSLRPVAVVEGQGRGEAGRGHAQHDRVGQDLPPGRLAPVQSVLEEVVQKQVVQVRVLVVGLLDVAQEHRANDATSSPHQGDSS